MKLLQLFESMTRDAIVKKMQDAWEQNGRYLNCRLAVQLTIGVPKLEELPTIPFDDIQIGDVIAWSIRHFAIWIGHGQIVQVGGWGEPVTIEDYKTALDYWDEPTAIYKNPER